MCARHGTVTDVRTAQRGSKRRTVYVDGEKWRSVPADVLRELGIGPGDDIDLDDTEARLASCEPRFARERALRLLAYRERSAAETRAKLLDDGYTPTVVEELVADLVASGLIDDARFAEILARSLVVHRGFGRPRARRELALRGVPDETAAEALESLAPASDEPERALRAARSALRPNDAPDRLASRLVRRGFSTADALRAAHRALADSSATGDGDEY